MPISFYYCPRCGYKTKFKHDMTRHFNRSGVCSSNYGIDLTDEIKMKVLVDRIYKPPKEQTRDILGHDLVDNNPNYFFDVSVDQMINIIKDNTVLKETVLEEDEIAKFLETLEILANANNP